MSLKLTPAQKSLLDEVNEKGCVTVSDTYKPGKKLVDEGLVDHDYSSYGRVKLLKVESESHA